MATCPSCESEVPEGANFCSKCGASLRSQALDRMIQDARRAVDNDPNDAPARHNLALAYKLGGMDELALREFVRVAELQPDFGDAHYEIAVLQERSGNREEAVAAARRALEVEPDHTRAKELLNQLSAS